MFLSCGSTIFTWGGSHSWRSSQVSSCAAPSVSSFVIPDEKALQFRLWLKELGHDDCGLRLHRYPPDSPTPGYGVMAGEGGVRKGQVVVKVPLRAFMSEGTAYRCPHVGPLIERAGLTPWQALCLHLLYERARGKESFWHPYLALLPKEKEMVELHPLLWSQSQCEEWLAGSPLLHRMNARFHQCSEDCEAIIIAGANELLHAGSKGFVSEMAVRWAAAILLSRAFSLDLDKQPKGTLMSDGNSTVLVPWADMLNHSSMAGKESCLQYDESTQVAFLYAHKRYIEGTQVFDSYGPTLSSSQLFLDYGFFDDEKQNHSVDFPAVVLGPIHGRANEALLDTIGLPSRSAMFCISENGVDNTVLTWARAALASSEELKEAGWIEDVQINNHLHKIAASCMAHFHHPISLENESKVLDRLLSACGTALTQYPTSIEEDRNLLSTVDHKDQKVPSLIWSRKQAIQLLIAEKLALRGAWKKLWLLSKRLQNGVHLSKLHKKSTPARKMKT